MEPVRLCFKAHLAKRSSVSQFVSQWDREKMDESCDAMPERASERRKTWRDRREIDRLTPAPEPGGHICRIATLAFPCSSDPSEPRRRAARFTHFRQFGDLGRQGSRLQIDARHASFKVGILGIPVDPFVCSQPCFR